MRRDICGHGSLAAAVRGWLVVSSLLIGGCGSEAEKPAASAPAEQPGAAPKPSATATPFVPVDACTLLTKHDVEAIVGKPVLDGLKEEVGPLVSCSFGDPSAPQVAGRPISQRLTLSVMTGQEGAYYAGPAAQAKDSLEMARKNAGSPETVAGVGDGAYWDKTFSKLSFVKGKYLVDVDVESDDGLAKAKAAATTVLEKLPQ